MQYARLLKWVLTSARAKEDIAAIARRFLYRGVRHTRRCAGCRLPVRGKTSKFFHISSRKQRVRENISRAALRGARPADQKALFPGSECPIMKIYVSNLRDSTSDADLAELFEPFGITTSAYVITSGVSVRCAAPLSE